MSDESEKYNTGNGRLRWVYQRLQKMSVGEVLHRVGEFSKSAEDWVRPLEEPSAPTTACPKWPLTASFRADLQMESLEADVNAMLSGSLRLLGTQWPAGGLTAWGIDPKTGQAWPFSPARSLRLDALGERAEVKHAWELLRLQHLQVLALGSAVLGREDATQASIQVLRSYLDWSRPGQGIGWAAGIECGSRIISLLVVAGLLSDHLNASDERRIWKELVHLARWIERYPSTHSSVGNHRIAELSALVILGCLGGAHPDAGRWMDYRDELVETAQMLILPDGGGAEQAIAYTAVTLEWLMVTECALQTRSQSLGMNGRLGRAAEALVWMVDDAGRAPDFGDNDRSSVIRTGLSPTHYVASVAACGLSMFGGDGLGGAIGPDLRASLLGLSPQKTDARFGRIQLSHAGYTVWRGAHADRTSLVVFDHGSMGLPPLYAHGHADTLAVNWHLGEYPILVDRGTISYLDVDGMRTLDRATASHSTVELYGRNPVSSGGPFMWDKDVETGFESLSDGTVIGWHRGYGGPIYRRVEVHSGGLRIVDDLGSHAPEAAVIRWHLDPALSAELTEYGARLSGPVTIDVRIDPGSKMRIVPRGHRLAERAADYNQVVYGLVLEVRPTSSMAETCFEVRAPHTL